MEDRAVDIEAVWRAFHAQLLLFVRPRVASSEDAEDLLQEVFARLHASATKESALGNLRAWLYQVTRNALVDYHRRRASAARRDAAVLHEQAATQSESPEMWGVTSAGLASPIEDADTAADSLSRCLRPMLAELPATQAEALVLTDLGELSQAEAARQLGLSPSGMKSRVQRGRAQLKELVLRCCEVELDPRRGVVDYTPRPKGDSASPRSEPGCGDCSDC